ncbi:MAG: hypothetical protein ABSD02_06525 [Steroidobacteraceae bacterium]|jgi:hypothetical protein
MSWLSRKRLPPMGHEKILVCAAALLAAAPVLAAEYYVQPTASIAAENDSNLDLNPGGMHAVQGYMGDAAALFSISTPESDTSIRPHIDYRNYPTDSADNRLEEYLDLNSYYKSQRSKASVYFGFERRDEINAELNAAFYNPYGPVLPTNPETGRTINGATRTSYILMPDYSYGLTPLTAVGVSAIVQQFQYSPTNTYDAIDFRYFQAKAYLRFALDQKDDMTVGAYGSKYQATEFDSTATAGGVSLQLDTNWSPLLTTTASVQYQHTTVEDSLPTLFKTTVSPWGANVAVTYKVAASQFRLNGGRVITPSGGGGIYVNDQVQLQYERDFTQRLSLTAAAVALRNHGVTSNVSGDDRTYVRPVVQVKYLLTQTFSVQGGYQYMWEKYQINPDGALNNRVYIQFTYQGLGRQW